MAKRAQWYHNRFAHVQGQARDGGALRKTPLEEGQMGHETWAYEGGVVRAGPESAAGDIAAQPAKKKVGGDGEEEGGKRTSLTNTSVDPEAAAAGTAQDNVAKVSLIHR
eukprot:1245587-Pyramimonas_sp.AAC.1